MLVPGLREFLERHQDLPMGVASNAEPENVTLFLEGAGLRPYFGAVVDGHQVARPKPYPDIYLTGRKNFEYKSRGLHRIRGLAFRGRGRIGGRNAGYRAPYYSR